MRTLVINSYAGSLTIAATWLGLDIIGSYEDANYGLDIQKHNLPHLNYIEHYKDWPNQDLSETFVVAHPPCSAFSMQNTSPSARGVNSAAFACTKKVLDYAMRNGAVGIAIESVMGALSGAWHFYQQAADERGYHIYRIIQNGSMFGAQWRERFWAVLIRKGAAKPELRLQLTPSWLTIQDVVDGWEDGPSAGNQEKLYKDQVARLLKDADCTECDLQYFFEQNHSPTVALGTLLWKRKYQTYEKQWVFEDFIGGFSSGTLVLLDAGGLAPTLMGGSLWWLNGRCVSENAFKRIGGFPGEYEFPDEPRNYASQMRTYISKGVMPPVAEWVLWQCGEHLGWKWPKRVHTNPYEIVLKPNLIADFRIRRTHWPWHPDNINYGDLRPRLRHFDD